MVRDGLPAHHAHAHQGEVSNILAGQVEVPHITIRDAFLPRQLGQSDLRLRHLVHADLVEPIQNGTAHDKGYEKRKHVNVHTPNESAAM